MCTVGLLLSACAGRDFTRPSLYQRLGGKGALVVVVDGWLARMAADAALARHFGEGDAARIRPLMVEYLCQLSGGPCVYGGRDLKGAHSGLAISAGDFEATLGALDHALDEMRVPERERKELRALLVPLHRDVISP